MSARKLAGTRNKEPRMFHDLLKTVAEAMDAGELMRIVETIWRSDREFTFHAFERTQRKILDMWKAAGLKTDMIEAPADGETIYGDLRMPIAWDCRSARLELLEPAERRCVLADRSSDPLAVVMWCGPTPPGGIEADLVRADDAKALAALGDYARGKFVYTKNHPHALKAAALKAGVAGMVSSHVRYPDATPDSRFWCNVWADAPDGWPQRRTDGLLPCMLLTPRQGREIEDLLTKERVRLRMAVDSNVYAGKIYMASGLLEGETDEEVLILGHAMEQGANDNATGCAVIVEAIRTLARLVRDGKLPKPRRTIRGLPVNECYGTIAFVEMRRKAVRKTVAGLNVDSVGRWAPELNAALRFTPNPDSLPSFTDTLLDRLLSDRLASAAPFAKVRRTEWCAIDNFLNDPAIGVPVTAIHTSDKWWHCGSDTMEKIDPAYLAAVAAASAAYLYFIAAAGRTEAEWLATQAMADWGARLEREIAAAMDRIAAAKSAGDGASALRAALDRMDFLCWVGEKTAFSSLGLVPATEREAARAFFKELAARARRSSALARKFLERTAGIAPAPPRESPRIPAGAAGLPDWAADAGCVIPVRKFAGMLTYDGIPPERREGKGSPIWDAKLMRAMMWIDGRRNLGEVLRMAWLDTGLPDRRILDEILFLARNGMVEWKIAKSAK